MKALSILIGLLSLAVLTSCGTPPPVKDPFPPTIDTDYHRVETSICGRWAVGDNGCVLPLGKVTGTLKIYRVWEGKVKIIGQGCSVDKSFSYPNSGGEWLEIDLKELLGEEITQDCVLNILQYPKFKGQDEAQFPIRGIEGTVVLGICPARTKCSFTSEQRRAGSSIPLWNINTPEAGEYMVRGCGMEVVPRTSHEDKITVDLKAQWPNGYPANGGKGCNFILAQKSTSSQQKIYRRVWLYQKSTVLLPAPAIDGNTATADATVSLSIADGEAKAGRVITFKPKAEGNLLRFYTVQGRSVVVKVKGGKIEWTQ